MACSHDIFCPYNKMRHFAAKSVGRSREIFSLWDKMGLAPGQAWGRGIDARRIVKPFVRTLRVTNPSRQSLASSRKRVLRPVRVTGGAKRRQPVPKPRD